MDTFDRALDLYRRGHLKAAADAAIRLLRGRPDDVAALRLLGMILLGLGHPADALQVLDRAIDDERRDPAAHANRAQVLRALGRLDEAAEALRRATRLDPKLADAWAELGAVERQRGDAPAAAVALGRSLEALPDRAVAVALADVVSTLPDPPVALAPALLVAYALDGVDHARFDRAAERVLAPLRDEPARLVRHPVLPAWLSRGGVHHPAWEGALIAARSWLLAEVRGGREVPLAALLAFGLHGWASEYAWSAPAEDDPAALGDAVLHRAAAAMYAPVVGPPDPALAPLFRACVDEPATERRLAAEVPELVPGDDATLRGMYEENPYPRIVGVQLREPVPFDRWLRATLPLDPDEPLPSGPIDVLVAGCGTGRHALTSATTWSGARVTAIDLSRASLGRAARRAAELGLANVRFARADLTGLGSWPERFHVVESVGVLHHLEDPREGLRVLVGLLRPGGLVRFGLYSELGRADVVAARAFVAERGFAPTPDGLRDARRALMSLPADHPARGVVGSPDFGSLSGFRDLVFHVRERRTTTAALAEDLAAVGARFLGFQHLDPAVPAAYARRWPDDPRRADLARWGELEEGMPRAFSGMYVGWAKLR